LASDPFETKNLSSDPHFKSTLLELRGRLDRWMSETSDKGRMPEPEKVYDSDMLARDPAGGARAPGEGKGAENVALMKRWAVERPMKVRVE
jgi:hypothetical protein